MATLDELKRNLKRKVEEASRLEGRITQLEESLKSFGVEPDDLESEITKLEKANDRDQAKLKSLLERIERMLKD